MIYFQAIQHGFGFVVVPLNQFFAALCALCFTVQHTQVIRRSALQAYAAAAQPVHQHLVRHVQFNNCIDDGKGIQRFRLRHCPGEPVQDIAVRAVRHCQP